INLDMKNLLPSVVASVIAVGLLLRWDPEWQKFLKRGPWIHGADLFDRIWYAHLDIAKAIRNLIHPRSLALYVLIVMSTFAVGMMGLFSLDDRLRVSWPSFVLVRDV